MPNIDSAKKRVRTTAKRTKINQSRRTRVRGYVRKVEEALTKGDKAAAQAALKAAEPEIMRGPFGKSRNGAVLSSVGGFLTPFCVTGALKNKSVT